MESPTAIAEEFQEYAYSVSHDLSAPVRAMVEFSRLLLRDGDPALTEQTQQYLEIIIENGRKLQAMMDGLLQFSRLNTHVTPFAPVSMRALLDQSCAQMQPRLLPAQLHVGPLPERWGDANQLTLLWTILLQNALLYQRAGTVPRIRIHASREGHGWRFSISDNGIGIAARHHDTIFKLFKRLHDDDTYPGLGMGLALAKKIVTRHGGTIGCSGAREGSTLYFTLPDHPMTEATNLPPPIRTCTSTPSETRL